MIGFGNKWRIFPLGCGLLLAACGGESGNLPGDTDDTQPFAGIATDATLHFTGTEPFWGGQVGNGQLIWTTPENSLGTSIAVTRFAGRGGVSFAGELQGARLDMTITPGECSDGMSDATYPYVATVQLGEDVLYGCAWDKDTAPRREDGREDGWSQLGLDQDSQSWGLDGLEDPAR